MGVLRARSVGCHSNGASPRDLLCSCGGAPNEIGNTRDGMLIHAGVAPRCLEGHRGAGLTTVACYCLTAVLPSCEQSCVARGFGSDQVDSMCDPDPCVKAEPMPIGLRMTS